MKNCPTKDEHEENIFVEVLIEEFINVLQSKMDTMIPQILLTLTLMPDEAWNRVAKMFNNRTGKNYNKMELKAKFERLCQHFLHRQPLFHQGGFCSDFHRTKFESSELSRKRKFESCDPIWPDYKRVKPEYGCQRRATSAKRANYAGEYRSDDNNFPCPDKKNVIHSNVKDEQVEISKWCHKVPCLDEKNVKFFKEESPRSDDGYGSGDGKNDKRSITDPGRSKGGSRAGIGAASNDESYSIDRCLTILNSMGGVDRHQHRAAVELFKDPYYRKYFVQLKFEKRLGWLEVMCKIT